MLLGYRTLHTALITYNIIPNPYLEGVVPRKAAALPFGEDGEQQAPGEGKIAVLLLAAKSNHPLGAFAPGHFGKIGDYLARMTGELEDDKSGNNGCK